LEKVIIARLIIRIVNACILNVFYYDFCEFLRDFGNLISESLYDKLIDYYQLRFQIEFNFRDAKQYWGLEDLASFISRFTLLQFTNLKKHEKAMPFGV